MHLTNNYILDSEWSDEYIGFTKKCIVTLTYNLYLNYFLPIQ